MCLIACPRSSDRFENSLRSFSRNNRGRQPLGWGAQSGFENSPKGSFSANVTGIDSQRWTL